MSEENQERPLNELREMIDKLDARLVEVINERAKVVVEIGKVKRGSGEPIYASDREQAVFNKITELNQGPLPQTTLNAIYRELMSGSFSLEKPLRVGYLGPDGSFSHQTAMRKFGASVEYVPLTDIQAVFEGVQREHVDMGVVPVENVSGGNVVDTLDQFGDFDIRIIAEVTAEIHQNLLANCPPEEVTAIASRPEALSQCQNWLTNQGRASDCIPVVSSARAAEMAKSEKGLAAIGSLLAAELYGLKVLFENIEDHPDNKTRFFVLGKTPPHPTGDDKTALMFAARNRAGALADVLNVFSSFGVNMLSLTSRPSHRGDWEYNFFVEVEGHRDDEPVAQAMKEAYEHCSHLRWLGSFPRTTRCV
jgi:chorismate mutase / prephenate dehydratase